MALSLQDKILAAATALDVLSLAGCKLTAESTKEEVRKAYLKLAMLSHPDKNQAPNAQDAFQRVSWAYRTICDPHAEEQMSQAAADAQKAASGQWHQHPDGTWFTDWDWRDDSGTWHKRTKEEIEILARVKKYGTGCLRTSQEVLMYAHIYNTMQATTAAYSNPEGDAPKPTSSRTQRSSDYGAQSTGWAPRHSEDADKQQWGSSRPEFRRTPAAPGYPPYSFRPEEGINAEESDYQGSEYTARYSSGPCRGYATMRTTSWAPPSQETAQSKAGLDKARQQMQVRKQQREQEMLEARLAREAKEEQRRKAAEEEAALRRSSVCPTATGTGYDGTPIMPWAVPSGEWNQSARPPDPPWVAATIEREHSRRQQENGTSGQKEAPPRRRFCSRSSTTPTLAQPAPERPPVKPVLDNANRVFKPDMAKVEANIMLEQVRRHEREQKLQEQAILPAMDGNAVLPMEGVTYEGLLGIAKSMCHNKEETPLTPPPPRPSIKPVANGSKLFKPDISKVETAVQLEQMRRQQQEAEEEAARAAAQCLQGVSSHSATVMAGTTEAGPARSVSPHQGAAAPPPPPPPLPQPQPSIKPVVDGSKLFSSDVAKSASAIQQEQTHIYEQPIAAEEVNCFTKEPLHLQLMQEVATRSITTRASPTIVAEVPVPQRHDPSTIVPPLPTADCKMNEDEHAQRVDILSAGNLPDQKHTSVPLPLPQSAFKKPHRSSLPQRESISVMTQTDDDEWELHMLDTCDTLTSDSESTHQDGQISPLGYPYMQSLMAPLDCVIPDPESNVAPTPLNGRRPSLARSISVSSTGSLGDGSSQEDTTSPSCCACPTVDSSSMPPGHSLPSLVPPTCTMSHLPDLPSLAHRLSAASLSAGLPNGLEHSLTVGAKKHRLRPVLVDNLD